MAEVLNYDDMIKKAEELEKKETLTDDQVEEIAKTLTENEPATVQDLHNAAKEAAEFKGEGVTEKAMAM